METRRKIIGKSIKLGKRYKVAQKQATRKVMHKVIKCRKAWHDENKETSRKQGGHSF